jgi:endoglucanase
MPVGLLNCRCSRSRGVEQFGLLAVCLALACAPETPEPGLGTGGAGNTGGGTTGGVRTGGASNTGGAPTGGKATGGKATGGTATGGTATGGKATGGAATGGATNGCGTVMRDITSMALVKDMGIGWNLGNTLDAIGSETMWGSQLTTQPMIQAIATSGFKSIRIPVTWMQHFGGAPGYVIDATWMNRVQQIVDWAVATGMYVIINMHHDGGWIEGAATNPTGVIAEYRALWAQIAQRFSCYSDKLVFESMNEVGFDTMDFTAAVALLNQINREFVTLVRASGGNNAQRHLLLAGYWTDITRSAGVVMADNRCSLSVHYYTPYQFTILGNPTTWGSAAEVATLKAEFALAKTSFIDKGIPVIVGEYGVVRTTEAASRVYWFEYVAKTAYDHGIAPFLWDGPDGEFDRTTLTWRTPGLLDALKRASSGQSYTPVKG